MHLTLNSDAQTALIDITAKVSAAVADSGIQEGFCHVYVPHTTAGITINESADPSVKRDILMVLNLIVPWNAEYQHMEGNSPAHVKSSLVGCSEWIAIEKGELVLGRWQGIFFCEFDGPRTRKVRVTFLSQQK